jgi:hypothetical protein
VLLHVLPPRDEMERERPATGLDSTAMRELAFPGRDYRRRLLPASNDRVEARVVHGNPSIEILADRLRAQRQPDRPGRDPALGPENLTRDRTIYRVLAHARCPVLTLREPTSAEVARFLSPKRLTFSSDQSAPQGACSQLAVEVAHTH